ncbi:MAG TPA: cupin domain-containing protein [Gaiellaceae bacterium]|nr:cupin domain-containing protein [Gaiellaceae bacterium]
MNTTTIAEITRKSGWAPLRKHLGAKAFGVNGWTGNAGEQVIAKHAEARTGQEELYVVVSGRATFTVDGEERDAPAGTVVLVPPEAEREAKAAEDGTTIVVVGGNPDKAYRAPSFETNAVVIELFGEGRIEDARELLRAVPEGEYADYETIAYNLACCEARLGNADDAFPQLERALTGRPDLVELAGKDDDLSALRGDPRFDELLAASATRG